jgi:hypothetical protein
LKFHKELKLFALFKNLIRKPFQTFFYSLKNLFEKIVSQNINLHLPKTYANSFAKEILTKGVISNKVAMPKGCLKINFKKYFYKVYSLNLKGLFSNYFLLCK